MIIYTLLGGYPPFHDENQTRLFRRIKAGSFKFHDEYWSNTSLEAKVRRCPCTSCTAVRLVHCRVLIFLI